MSCTQFAQTDADVLFLPNAAIVSELHPNYYLLIICKAVFLMVIGLDLTTWTNFL